MINKLIEKLKVFATTDLSIESIIIVGSYANGSYTKNSDLDLCIITSKKNQLLKNHNFINDFGVVAKKTIEYYGACTSIRVFYINGLEVEFGIVAPSWINLPLEHGTYKVLKNGYKIIYDKKKYFENIN